MAHLLQPDGTEPPPLDEEARMDLQDFLRSFQTGFFSDSREESVRALVRRLVEQIDYNEQSLTFALDLLRELFSDVEWIALLLPSGIDPESDRLLTNPRFLQKVIRGEDSDRERPNYALISKVTRHRNERPGLILQLNEPPRGREFILQNVFPAFNIALAELSRWPGVLVWTRDNSNSDFIPLPTEVSRIEERLNWIIKHAEEGDLPQRDKKWWWYASSDKKPLRIIHLSDLHLGSEIATLRLPHIKQLIRNVVDELRGYSTIVPLVTGDLMDTPSPTNLSFVRDFVGFLRDLRVSDPITLIGNHDVRKGGIWQPELRQALALPKQEVVWYDESNVGLLCFDSVRGGDLAKGLIGQDQREYMGDLLDREPEKSKKYDLVAALHHHPIPVDSSKWLHTEWYERLLGKWQERTDKLIDADLFNQWLRERNCIAALHGHKHIPRADFENNISYIGCGSTSGKVPDYKGQTHISINVITIEPQTGRLSCRLRAEKVTGTGLNQGDLHEVLYRAQTPYAA